jgi:tRNA(adenine34) deaminase
MPEHRRFLELCLEQAAIAGQEGSTPVGCVIVAPDGGIVATERNRMKPNDDPTAHAEMVAVRSAGIALWPDPRGGDYTLYTSGEPCLMCVGLVLLSPINTLVWAAGPIVLSGSAWDAVAASGFNASRINQVNVIREPDPEMRLRSRKLLFEFLTERGDHDRAAIVRD